MGVPGRRIAIGLAVVLLAGAGPLGAPLGAGLARAGSPPTVDLSMPPTGDAAAVALTTVDAPPELPDVIDVDPLIAAANAATDALPAADWEVDALAATLGDDPDAAFALVRDAIRFDAYAGVLRGAEGTLAARAGNAWDRALLLLSLLRATGQTARLATGDLDPSTAEAVLARAFGAPFVALPEAGDLGVAPGLAAAIRTRAARDLALLETAGAAATDDPADDRAAALADIARHAWVQVERDGAWLDLDPTLADAAPGATLTSVTGTFDAVPADAIAGVTIRLVAESLVNGEPITEIVLDQRLDAAAAADQQVLLYFGPMSGGGGGLLSVGGPDVVVPVLSVGGTPALGTEFIISASEGGGLLGGSTDTDLVRLTLEIESPAGAEGATIGRQVLLDRAPAEARDAGTVTQDTLLPPDGGVELPIQLRGVRHVLVSTGGVSPRVANNQRAWGAWAGGMGAADPSTLTGSVEHAYWPVGIVDQELVVGSELAVIPGVDDADARAFIAQPRVYVTTTGADPVDTGRLVATTDLLIDPVRILAADGAPADTAARHRAWYGVLQAALETEHGLAQAAALDPDDREVVGASLAITDAPLGVLAPDTAGSLPDGTPSGIRVALEDGRTVVVAGDPAAAHAWWEVAADGSVRAILAPSLGGVGRVGGPRPPGVPRVTPPQQLPNQLPKPPRPPIAPQVPRPAPQPPSSPPACTGNEQTILQRCVAFYTQLTMTQLVVGVVYTIVTVGALVILGIVLGGG